MKKIISMLLVVAAFMPVLGASAAGRFCTHKQYTDKYSYSEYEPIRNNANVHTVVNYYTRKCNDCRETISENIRVISKTEAHSFAGHRCTSCGFEKERFTNPTPEKPQPAIDMIDPEITSFYTSKGTDFLKSNSSVKVIAKSTDNVKVTKMICYLDGKQISQTSSDKMMLTVAGSKFTAGRHTLKICAYDASGNETSETLKIRVR